MNSRIPSHVIGQLLGLARQESLARFSTGTRKDITLLAEIVWRQMGKPFIPYWPEVKRGISGEWCLYGSKDCTLPDTVMTLAILIEQQVFAPWWKQWFFRAMWRITGLTK